MKKWRFLSLRTQLLSYYLLATAVLVIVMGMTLFYSTSGIIRKEVAKTTATAIDKSGNQLEMYIDRLKGLSDLLAHNPQVLRYFGQPQAGSAVTQADKTDIGTLVNSILSVDKKIESIILIGADGRIISNEKNLDMSFTGRLQDQEWYQEALAEKMPVLTSARMQEFSMDKDKWVISLGRELKDEQGGHLGVLRIDLRYEAVESILNDLDLGQNGCAFILNDKNQVVYHKDTAYFGDAAKRDELIYLLEMNDNELSREQMLVHRYHLNNTEWLLVGAATLDSAVKMQQDIILALWILGSVMLMIAFISSSMFAASVSKPFRQLERIMSEVEQGNFKIDAAIKGSIEIENLSKHFQSMIKEIQTLVEEIRLKEKTLRTSELKALHSQINPHFLYNTLGTIVWLAELGDMEKVVAVSKAMASFFRLSLRGGSEITTVREELEHVRQYLLIQKERYQEKLSFEIQTDEGLEEISIPKIILQPLVENAIYHGIRQLPGKGMIRIKAARTDGGLLLSVEDNGQGFNTEVPLKREGSARLGGVGLQNIDERLKLYYGDGYGLTIESTQGKGTKVTLRLQPASNLKEKI